MKKKEQIKGKKRANKYEQKLAINGSFDDVIKAAMSGNPVSKKKRPN